MSDQKDVSYYRRLPYTRRVEKREGSEGEPYYVARIEELPALRIDGETREKALHKLNESFDDFIDMMLEQGDEIPEPESWPERVGIEYERSRAARVTDVEGAGDEGVDWRESVQSDETETSTPASTAAAAG